MSETERVERYAKRQRRNGMERVTLWLPEPVREAITDQHTNRPSRHVVERAVLAYAAKGREE